jgi:hypothetical protein
MLYLEMAAGQEQIRETRRQVEHNRLEANLAQARLSHEAALQETLPYTSMFTTPLGAWKGGRELDGEGRRLVEWCRDRRGKTTGSRCR